jgi:hypothetical protein
LLSDDSTEVALAKRGCNLFRTEEGRVQNIEDGNALSFCPIHRPESSKDILEHSARISPFFFNNLLQHFTASLEPLGGKQNDAEPQLQSETRDKKRGGDK